MQTPDMSRAIWVKSSRSNAKGSCVELAQLAEVAGVRDSKNPTGPALTFGKAELTRFLGAVKAGRLDG
ncbi:protein of unknown function (DUF397) [Goodfellowiella coeruleoviolacea]|uniref:DUF397 domain-containing protein n=2 Tax=Goodfellowiella coeruleoviolacea TaxID=334858 RepID=A0AAE3KHX3_9PSEU|nr:protein of unknown function (DUF397) [Goodfellowiella coeruleoviolacea]